MANSVISALTVSDTKYTKNVHLQHWNIPVSVFSERCLKQNNAFQNKKGNEFVAYIADF